MPDPVEQIDQFDADRKSKAYGTILTDGVSGEIIDGDVRIIQ